MRRFSIRLRMHGATAMVLEQLHNGAHNTTTAAAKMLARARQHIGTVVTPIAAIDKIVSAETAATQAEGQDEAAELLRALAQMQSALAGLVGDLRQTGDNILGASNGAASGKLDLSGRTGQTASSLQHAASAVQQLTQRVQHSAESARHASDRAHSASGVAERGGAVVAEVVRTMPARCATTHPLRVANARHSADHGCALRLDRACSGGPLDHAGFIHTWRAATSSLYICRPGCR